MANSSSYQTLIKTSSGTQYNVSPMCEAFSCLSVFIHLWLSSISHLSLPILQF